MGVFGGSVSSGESYKDDSRNPNPLCFTVKSFRQIGDILIARVYYPGCVNYEGNKILVWKGLRGSELLDLKEIDPHFTENSKLIARFAPTEEGLSMAINFAKSLQLDVWL